MQNYSYLKPPTQAYRIKLNNTSRSLFDEKNITYSKEEIEAINRLREYLKHKYPSKQYDNALLLRYCCLGSFQTTQSIQKFKYYEMWENLTVISKEKLKGILHSGVFYSYGRDQQYSPSIYFHPSRVILKQYQPNDYLSALKTLLEPIISHMLINGKIQQWNVIVDLRNFNEQILNNNLKLVEQYLLQIIFGNPFRLKKIFIIQKGSSYFWGRSNTHGSQIEKVLKLFDLDKKCIKITNLNQFDRYIPRQERQVEYGGELEDLREYWPINSTNKLMDVNSRFVDQSADSCDYESVQNFENQEFFREKEQGSSFCDLKSNCKLI